MSRFAPLFAAALAAVSASSSQAADAIVVSEPEPAEFVRICDAYGTGFLYIPGTETCLRVGGYVRHQMNYNNRDVFDEDTGERMRSYTFSNLTRAAPSLDVRSETEWGTLRAFWQTFFNSNSLTGYSVQMEHAFIAMKTDSGTFLLGKTDTPFFEFLGYWAGPTIYEGIYGGDNTNHISYTFDAGNGFSAVVAAVDPGTIRYMPNIEAGAKFSKDRGWIAAAIAYDDGFDQFAARLGIGANVPGTGISLSAHAMYAGLNGGGMYALSDEAGSPVEWSALFGGSARLTGSVALNSHLQWFDTDEWSGAVNLTFTPVAGMRIIPELSYASATDTTGFVLRFQRDF